MLCDSFVKTVSQVCQISVKGSAFRVLMPVSGFPQLHVLFQIKNLIEEAQCQNHYTSTRYASDVNCGRPTITKGYTDKFLVLYLGFLIKKSVLEPTST